MSCHLREQEGRHHLQQEDPDSAAWLDELTRPVEVTGELPGVGRRRLASGAGQVVRAVAKMPRWSGRPRPEPADPLWRPQHRAQKPRG